MTRQFDRYASDYQEQLQKALALPGTKADFFWRFKADHILCTCRELLGPPEGLRLLDVGCGSGFVDLCLAPQCGSLSGVDVAREQLALARENVPEVDYQWYDGSALPYPEGYFDVAFAICVLHHICVPERLHFVREMKRVVRPGGCVAIYEHNPLNPLTRLTVSQCEFDRGVKLVSRRQLCAWFREAGMQVIRAPWLLLFPWQGAFFRRVEGWLRGVPLGAQYAVCGRV